MPIYFTNTASINQLQVTGSTVISSSTGLLLQLIGSGSTLMSISGSGGEILRVDDSSTSTNYITVSSASINIFEIRNNITSSFTGSLLKNGYEVDSYYTIWNLGTSVSTGANTTPVDLTGFSFTYEASSSYIFDFYMMVAPAAAGTGCGFAISCSTAVSQSWVTFVHQLANTGTQSGGHSRTSNGVATGVSSGMPTADVPNPVMGRGWLKTGALTGTAKIQFQSETTAVTTCVSGSMVIVKKIKFP